MISPAAIARGTTESSGTRRVVVFALTLPLYTFLTGAIANRIAILFTWILAIGIGGIAATVTTFYRIGFSHIAAIHPIHRPGLAGLMILRCAIAAIGLAVGIVRVTPALAGLNLLSALVAAVKPIQRPPLTTHVITGKTSRAVFFAIDIRQVATALALLE